MIAMSMKRSSETGSMDVSFCARYMVMEWARRVERRLKMAAWRVTVSTRESILGKG